MHRYIFLLSIALVGFGLWSLQSEKIPAGLPRALVEKSTTERMEPPVGLAPTTSKPRVTKIEEKQEIVYKGEVIEAEIEDLERVDRELRVELDRYDYPDSLNGDDLSNKDRDQILSVLKQKEAIRSKIAQLKVGLIKKGEKQ